jgi:hypothetical protein
MLGKCLCLIILWVISLTVNATSNSDLIDNLRGRLHPLKQGGHLIKSFTSHSQSYIYDQALAIIAFSKSGDQKSAKELLTSLNYLQRKDGSLYFSYYLNGKSPYPEEGDKRFAGAIAWVALAAVTYQQQFKTTEFLTFNANILKYLSSQLKTANLNGKMITALRFSPSDIPETAWNETEIAALEHNLDAYSAFLHFAQINKDKKAQIISDELKEFILSMWNESGSHFWSGANLKTGVINKEELYLDNQTWSLLALNEQILKGLNPKQALALNCESFLVEHEGIFGFMDTKPSNRPSQFKFVWSEGSLGQILAIKKLNKHHKGEFVCKGLEADSLLKNIGKMKQKDGGIAYATTTDNPDFTSSSSVAGTAWYYFAANNINPFEVSDLI